MEMGPQFEPDAAGGGTVDAPRRKVPSATVSSASERSARPAPPFKPQVEPPRGQLDVAPLPGGVSMVNHSRSQARLGGSPRPDGRSGTSAGTTPNTASTAVDAASSAVSRVWAMFSSSTGGALPDTGPRQRNGSGVRAQAATNVQEEERGWWGTRRGNNTKGSAAEQAQPGRRGGVVQASETPAGHRHGFRKLLGILLGISVTAGICHNIMFQWQAENDQVDDFVKVGDLSEGPDVAGTDALDGAAEDKTGVGAIVAGAEASVGAIVADAEAGVGAIASAAVGALTSAAGSGKSSEPSAGTVSTEDMSSVVSSLRADIAHLRESTEKHEQMLRYVMDRFVEKRESRGSVDSDVEGARSVHHASPEVSWTEGEKSREAKRKFKLGVVSEAMEQIPPELQEAPHVEETEMIGVPVPDDMDGGAKTRSAKGRRKGPQYSWETERPVEEARSDPPVSEMFGVPVAERLADVSEPSSAKAHEYQEFRAAQFDAASPLDEIGGKAASRERPVSSGFGEPRAEVMSRQPADSLDEPQRSDASTQMSPRGSASASEFSGVSPGSGAAFGSPASERPHEQLGASAAGIVRVEGSQASGPLASASQSAEPLGVSAEEVAPSNTFLASGVSSQNLVY